MFETVFALLAAMVTIIIAGILVRKQNERYEKLKHLDDMVEDSMEQIICEAVCLTREEPAERSLGYLEKRMKSFNDTLDIVCKPTYPRRGKRVKYKKDFTNN